MADCWDGDLVDKRNKYKLNFEAHIRFPWFFLNIHWSGHCFNHDDKEYRALIFLEGEVGHRLSFRRFSSTCLWWATYQNVSNFELAYDRKCCFVLFIEILLSWIKKPQSEVLFCLGCCALFSWCCSVLCYSVHLVELQGTGELYAMKAMEKSVMLNRNKVWVFLR